MLSHVQFFGIPWTVAHQTPLTMEFSRQEYWSGLSFPSPRDLPDPGIEPGSPTLWADSLLSEPPGKPFRQLALYFIPLLLLGRQSLELPPPFHLPVHSQENLASGCFNFINRVNDDLLSAKCQGCF